jgi:hypothetical protein
LLLLLLLLLLVRVLHGNPGCCVVLHPCHTHRLQQVHYPRLLLTQRRLCLRVLSCCCRGACGG